MRDHHVGPRLEPRHQRWNGGSIHLMVRRQRDHDPPAALGGADAEQRRLAHRGGCLNDAQQRIAGGAGADGGQESIEVRMGDEEKLHAIPCVAHRSRILLVQREQGLRPFDDRDDDG